MTARPKICFDRILPKELMQNRPVRRAGGRVRAINPRGTAWINGSKLQVRFLAGTTEQRKLVRTQAAWWTAVANLSFDFNDAPNAEIRIAFDENDGAWSYIGTDNKGIPLNEPTMNLGFLDGGTAAHEFGHAIGLAHEHQNPAIGIQWNEPVVIAEMKKSPNFWDEATTRHNIIEKYKADQVNGTAFDPKSIMLYFFPASWTLNGIGTEANDVLSAIDKMFVAGAKMYPGVGAGTPSAVELKVNAPKRTDAAIGKGGEEDLFKFTAKSSGKYTIDTTGPTDVVMKLFGPGSKTALITEDDDGGLGTNARISASLVAGEYFVQIRHFSKKATGKYAIGVKKV